MTAAPSPLAASAAPPAPSSATLGSAARTDASFESLLEPILGLAYRLALQLTRNATDAEDVVQDAALLAFKGFRTFVPGTNFKAWFLRILTHAFFARYRKARRAGTAVPLDDVPELHLYTSTRAAGLHERSEDPAGDLIARMDSERISAAIQSLPEPFRGVVALYFVGDLSYVELSETLDCPVGTVRSRLHRGRRMLQVALWDMAVELGLVRGTPPAETL